jgi:murein DD-endopeptidase MepM/ murein hydrolase activator NlpD
MLNSALANRHSLVSKMLFAGGALVAAAATLAPQSAFAASAAASAASDNFRVAPEDVEANKTALGVSDPEFRALHDGWGRIKGASSKSDVAIPAINPVTSMDYSSNFGLRRAPMRHASRNHKGVDIRGPIGTPIYATADAMVGRANWVSGYGKLIELEHGNAIQTRYGHLSALNVVPGQRVRQGDLIGFMGSTGRSTGSHLHYEVRIGGEAVNPISFLPVAATPAPAPVAVATAPSNITFVSNVSNKLPAATASASESAGGPTLVVVRP